MKDKIITEEMLFEQLEDALEERQGSDRRKNSDDLPTGVINDRRQGDRRTEEKTG